VRLHLAPLLVRELARLGQNPVGNPELPDVVQEAGGLDQRGTRARDAEALREHPAVGAHPLDVAARRRVSELDRARQAVDRLLPRERHRILEPPA
jgi:hypothetical protein